MKATGDTQTRGRSTLVEVGSGRFPPEGQRGRACPSEKAGPPPVTPSSSAGPRRGAQSPELRRGIRPALGPAAQRLPSAPGLLSQGPRGHTRAVEPGQQVAGQLAGLSPHHLPRSGLTHVSPMARPHQGFPEHVAGRGT